MVLSNHSYILLEDNSLWAIGDNDYGQVGFADEKVGRYYNPVKIMEDIMEVSVGQKHGVIIDWAGRLLVVGSNKDGQLGTTSTTEKAPVEVKLFDGSATNKVIFKSISCGKNFSTAIDIDGRLWVCGDNSLGQIGPDLRPDKNNRKRRWEHVDIYDEDTNEKLSFFSVKSGDTHSILLTEDRERIYSMGNNTEGELGIGNMPFERGPVKTLHAHAAETTERMIALNLSGRLNKSTYMASNGLIDDIQWYDLDDIGQPIDEDGEVVYINDDPNQGVIEPTTKSPKYRFGKNYFNKIETVAKTNFALENDGTLWVWGYWNDEIYHWPRKLFENALDFKITGRDVYVLVYMDDIRTNVYRVGIPEWRDNNTRQLQKESELTFYENPKNKVRMATTSVFLKVKVKEGEWEKVY